MKPRLMLAVGGAAVFLTLVSLMLTEQIAQACGGCFAPAENNTVVTDHRMVLTVSPQQTTLYDQIRYQGSPESFAWVLPIKGEALVGVSSDAVFSVLDQTTSVQVLAPPRNCPAPPDSCNRARGGTASADSGSAPEGGVSVLRQETVGPYETVQLRSTDPAALTKWLGQNGYRIGPETQPIIAAYVNEQFDFLALKLIPGKDVTSMKPVRVSTRGAAPNLPLRMVTAGVGANVGISLWVMGDGRWEPQNFQSFVVKPQDLVWSWTTNSSNFRTVRAERNTLLGGSAWEVETSTQVNTPSLASQIGNLARFNPRTGRQSLDEEYPPVRDANGVVVRTAESLFQEDMGFLFESRPLMRVTRMRADLPQASLANDLNLQASADQSELPRTRQVTRESDQPSCPVFDNECNVIGNAPRDQANLRMGAGGAGCAAGASRSDVPGALFSAIVAAASFALLGHARRRRLSR
jgi:hypothetical protein